MTCSNSPQWIISFLELSLHAEEESVYTVFSGLLFPPFLWVSVASPTREITPLCLVYPSLYSMGWDMGTICVQGTTYNGLRIGLLCPTHRHPPKIKECCLPAHCCLVTLTNPDMSVTKSCSGSVQMLSQGGMQSCGKRIEQDCWRQ